MSIVSEFKEFALKGNVVDLAVGVVIGAAFGSIVTSLVTDIITPPIGWLTGGIDFSKLAFELPQNPAAPPPEEPARIAYGKFINSCISFALVAWVMFMIIKGMNALKRKEEAAPAAPAEPAEEVKLLREIRDALKTR